jgi:hypothetical protein
MPLYRVSLLCVEVDQEQRGERRELLIGCDGAKIEME